MSDDKLNIDDIDFFDDEETYDVITVTDDNGVEEDYFVIDGIVENEVRYLLLVKAEEYDLDEPEAFIFKEIDANDDELTYVPVEDEAEYNKILILLQNDEADYIIEN